MRGLYRRIREATGRPGPRPLILMYHRVASPAVDPWGLSVNPDRFEAHLQVLRAHRTPLSVSEMVACLERGTLPADAVAVTFDDGYVDNLVEARPRLQAMNIPATLFVAVGAIDQSHEFWWDEVARAILGRHDALDCEVIVEGHACRVSFAEGSDDPSWRAWREPRSERQRAYLDLWSRLRLAGAAERELAMSRFRTVSHTPMPDPADLPMSACEVEQIASGGWFEIGGHTVSHPVLPLLAPAERRREILIGKERCEKLAHHRIDGFAYPHGAVDDDCREAVREGGFSWGCTTATGFVSAACDRFALPRLFVQDWDRDTFEKALS